MPFIPEPICLAQMIESKPFSEIFIICFISISYELAYLFVRGGDKFRLFGSLDTTYNKIRSISIKLILRKAKCCAFLNNVLRDAQNMPTYQF